MAVLNTAITNRQLIYVHLETTNQSFLDMHYYLKHKGIKNNTFFLALYDPDLAGIDPRDPNLSPLYKQKVLRECIVNYWYYLREVLRIPASGGSFRYRLDRGSLAMNYLYTLNCNMYVELPRQFGKTTTAVARYLWVYNFGSTNSEIMFMHKSHDGSKGNLRRLREFRDALPSYLQMSSATGIDGRKLKVPNTIVSMQHPINNNKITTFASARSKAAANNLGRGATVPIQYWDEFAWMPFNGEAYGAAIPAYSTAKELAQKNHAPYGIVLTSTPGDLTTKEGQYAYKIHNDATPWNESYYDLTMKEFEELKESNHNSSFFLIRYTYQQLGKGMDYFNQMCRDLENDWPNIRREILLEWAQVSDDCPFNPDDLDIIAQYCHDPIRTLFFGRAHQYQFLVYEDIDLRYPPIVGVDPSGATHHDSSSITVIDSRTTKVCATFNCNYIPADDLADILYKLATDYMPSCVINIERNGGFGLPIIARLIKTPVKKNLYYEIKEKIVEESFNGYRVDKQKKLVKVYGTDSTKEVRNRMIEILFDRVQYHKDKFIAKILHDEMATMVQKPSGKIEHSPDAHDDQIFSYLHALRPLYDNAAFLSREFGIHKFSIRTDDDTEVIDGDIDAAENGYEFIDVNQEDDDDINSERAKTEQYIAEASKYKTAQEFNTIQEKADEDYTATLIASDRLAKLAYDKKYHTNQNDQVKTTVRLPDSIFMQNDYDGSYDDETGLLNKVDNGNLNELFNRV